MSLREEIKIKAYVVDLDHEDVHVSDDEHTIKVFDKTLIEGAFDLDLTGVVAFGEDSMGSEYYVSDRVFGTWYFDDFPERHDPELVEWWGEMHTTLINLDLKLYGSPYKAIEISHP
jgi:hypothetical protein